MSLPPASFAKAPSIMAAARPALKKGKTTVSLFGGTHDEGACRNLRTRSKIAICERYTEAKHCPSNENDGSDPHREGRPEPVRCARIKWLKIAARKSVELSFSASKTGGRATEKDNTTAGKNDAAR
jgi:hypothetical protein